MSERDELAALRKEIDRLDEQIFDLLGQRATKVLKVAQAKSRAKLPPFDPSRERQIIERLKARNTGPLTPADIEEIAGRLFAVYRSLGRPLEVAYLGPPGTYTHQAALRHFGGRNRYLPCRTIESVFRHVEKGRVDYGVVPIENSTEGVVTYTIDMFIESDVKITSEILQDIHHCLLSRERSLGAVNRLFSNPQALAQCQKWVEERLPRVVRVETESTAAAAFRARRTPRSAAIGSEVAAEIYGLNVLASNIEDYRENITRFFVLGRDDVRPTGKDKTSILFSVKDRVGALHDMLVPFKTCGINLMRIESRPSKRKAWEYVFFVDFGGHQTDAKVKKALEELRAHSVFMKVLGSYPRGGMHG
mgnify:CR=1 FL=1